MTLIFRILVGTIGLLIAGHQINVVYGFFTGPYSNWYAYPLNASVITLGLLALWYALAGPQDLDRIGRTLAVGLLVGAVGLVAGIAYGGIVLPLSGRRPGNLYPLIGILMTGPAGFVLGCLGAVLWRKILPRRGEA